MVTDQCSSYKRQSLKIHPEYKVPSIYRWSSEVKPDETQMPQMFMAAGDRFIIVSFDFLYHPLIWLDMIMYCVL